MEDGKEGRREGGKEGPPFKEGSKQDCFLLIYKVLNKVPISGNPRGLNPTWRWLWALRWTSEPHLLKAHVAPSSGSKEKDLKDLDLRVCVGGGRIRTQIHICSDNMSNSKLSAHRGGECGQQLVASSKLPFW